MAAIPIALGAYKRDAGFLPEMRLRNLVLEKTPADAEKIVLLPRPGLTVKSGLSGTQVPAVFAGPGLVGGSVFALCNGQLWVDGASVGSLGVAADQAARFAASPAEMAFCVGDRLCRTDGVTLTFPAFPDDAGVRSVAFLDSYFLAARADSARVYFSAVNDASTWDGLSYFEAESHPGHLLDVLAVNDLIALIGQQAIEFWQANPTGAADLPFTRADGLTFSKGALNTGAAVYADNTLVWVGSDGIVYRRSAVPQRISDHGIEEQIAKAGQAYLYSFVWRGHTMLMMSLPDQTWIYDFETGEWTEFSTLGRDTWRAVCACSNGLNPVFGDGYAGNVLELQETALTDNDDGVERRFTALLDGQADVKNIWLDAQGGIGPDPSAVVTVELSISRDGSQTWSPFMQANLGKQGEYRKRASWRRLGRSDMGYVLDFRVTDPSLFTIQGVRVNEDMSGRAV